MWPVALSRRLPVVALVGFYPTNKLIGNGPISDLRTFAHKTMRFRGVIRYYRHFRKGAEAPPLSLSPRCVTHSLLTRPPLTYQLVTLKIGPFDLHALATPPAFVLSQDQTRHFLSLQRRPSRASPGQTPFASMGG